jgi:hypothetical protein
MKKKRRTYQPRILGEIRTVVEEEWPEPAHKLPPRPKRDD